MESKASSLKCPCTQDCQRRSATCHGDKEYCPEYYEYWERKSEEHKRKERNSAVERYQIDSKVDFLTRKEKERKHKGVFINRR